MNDDPLYVLWSGIVAGYCGDDPRTCPYDKLTKEWQEWQRGHAWGLKLWPGNGEGVARPGTT